MEKEIIKFYKEEKREQLKENISGQTVSNLKAALEKSLRSSKDPLVLTKAVFQGLDIKNGQSAETLMALFKHLVLLLGKSDFSHKLADDVIWVLLMECSRLTGPCLAALAQFFVDSVKSGSLQGGKSLNVFPKILSVIETQDSIVYGENSMKGTEFKGHVLNSLCSCKWSPQTVIHLAAMFKDVPLTSDELKFVLEKILRQFDDLDLRDIPALVYQMLLLSEKGHKQLILEGITSFFITKDTLARSQANMMDSDDLMEDALNIGILRQTEGTVILHVSFAVMEDRELGQEFLKYLKTWQFSGASRVLSPFTVALALSIAGVNVLNEQILNFLKSTVLRSFQDYHRHKQSYWVRENFPEHQDIGQMVLETVANSSSGWEHVVRGLVQLGFLLMDSFGPRLVFGRPETVVTGQLTPGQSACRLGNSILLRMFKGHEIVRTEILDQIFNRVMTETSAPASHYLSLLSEIVMSAPLFLLESVGKVQEAFDCLPLLPPATAQGLLVALLPLLKVSMSLKDSLILLLRKSIFSRQLDECKIGVQGYLAILKSFKVLGGIPCSQASQSSQPFSSSQVPVDVHNQYNRASNEALCLEILGILKRCLSQQADVRLCLYQGLFDVLTRNTQLKAPIMDMLHKQIKKKWKDLLSQAKRDVYARKYPKTGGGPKLPEGEFTDIILEILGADNPVLHGIEEGAESGNTQLQSSFCSIPEETTVTIPVRVGVPFSIPVSEAIEECEEVVHEAHVLSNSDIYTIPSGQLNTSTSTVTVDVHRENHRLISTSPPLGIPDIYRQNDICSTSTIKRNGAPLFAANAKVPKKNKYTHEDLVNADTCRVILEKEKLALEIRKIQAETENIEQKTRLLIKKEEFVNLQMEVLHLQRIKLNLQINEMQHSKNK